MWRAHFHGRSGCSASNTRNVPGYLAHATLLLIVAWASARSALAAESTVTISSALGVDTNVFLADSSGGPQQGPQTSMVVQTNLDARIGGAPAKAHRLSLAVQALHRHYFRFREADRLFVDSAAAYRYALRPSLLLGLVQTASYARMQLFDTEGGTLPRKLFSAFTGEARGYLQTLAGRSFLTVGAGVRRRDINETEDQFGVPFLSLDHQGYFVYVDGTVRPKALTLVLGYEYAVTHYDEVLAASRGGVANRGNPLLTLVQHIGRSQVVLPIAGRFRVAVDGQYRWVIDPFEGDLTYRQVDVTPKTLLQLPSNVSWSASVGYRTRVYAERPIALGSSDQRHERFLVADTTLQHRWTVHWSSTLQAQFLRKASNIPGDQFRERLYLLGLTLSL